MNKIIKEKTENLIMALNDAFECLDDGNEIRLAASDLNTMQAALKTILPAAGIYAWSVDNMDGQHVMAYPSVQEAEQALADDIEEQLRWLNRRGYAASYKDACVDGDEIMLSTEDGIFTWKRLYGGACDRYIVLTVSGIGGPPYRPQDDVLAQASVFLSEDEAVRFIKEDSAAWSAEFVTHSGDWHRAEALIDGEFGCPSVSKTWQAAKAVPGTPHGEDGSVHFGPPFKRDIFEGFKGLGGK